MFKFVYTSSLSTILNAKWLESFNLSTVKFAFIRYDKYVKPEVDITDYRTELSGITAEKLSEKGEPLQKVQKEVAQLLKGRVVIGHAIPNDFKVS